MGSPRTRTAVALLATVALGVLCASQPAPSAGGPGAALQLQRPRRLPGRRRGTPRLTVRGDGASSSALAPPPR